jgi:hypothetical protein
MTDANKILAARYAQVAERAPGLVVRLWVVRIALAVVAIAGTLQLANLTLWGLRAGHSALIALIVAHVLAIGLALGTPVHHDTVSGVLPFSRIVRGYGDRGDRLRALGFVVLIEFAVQLLLPPIMTLVGGHLLRWPVQFVVAGAACLVVWPLQRIAASQRLEASRLNALES